MAQRAPTSAHRRPGEAAGHANYLTTYDYDRRGNVTETKAPDATHPARYRYDRAGRLRFSKDGRQHASNQAAFTVYDAFSRPVRSGVASGVDSTAFNNLTPDQVQPFELTTANWRGA